MRSIIKITKTGYYITVLLKRDDDRDIKSIQNKSKRFRDLLQSYGPAYIKLGQILSLRYDLFHKETCNILESLQDKTTSIKYSIIKNIIKEDLGSNYKLIEYIEQKPLGVASIAQVHRIKFHKHDAVLKIQKPGAARIIKHDLDLISNIVKVLKTLGTFKKFNVDALFSEFKASLLRELDFEIEAENTERFSKIYENFTEIKVPTVYKELTTRKTLALEYIEGINMKEVIASFHNVTSEKVEIRNIIIYKNQLIDTFVKIVFEQIFVKGFFHGDPHPSNVIVRKDRSIGLIDFGVVVNLSTVQVKILHNLLLNLANRNVEGFVENLIALDTKGGHKDKEFIIESLKPYFDKFDTLSNKEYSPTKLFLDIVYSSLDYDIELPGFIVLLGKVLSIYDGLLIAIEPSSNLIDLAKPYFKNYTAKQLLKDFDISDLESNVVKALQSIRSIPDLITNLPADLKNIIYDLKINNNTVTKEIIEEKHSSFKSKLLFIYLNISFVIFMLSSLVHLKADILGFDVHMLLGINWIVVLILSLYSLIKDK